MSRIGNNPVAIPEGVTVDVNDNVVTVKGKLGELSQDFNAVTINVDNGGSTNSSVDLVAVSVADVVSLANVDNGGVLSFANVIADTATTPNLALAGLGSVGGANAQVVLQDAFPPMVESAEWDGTTFTIVFNEGVAVPTGTDTLDLHVIDATDATGLTKATITLNAAETTITNAGYFTYDANTFTLVVNVSAGVEATFVGSASSDEEYYYADDIAGSSSEEQHAILNWDSLDDLNGNNWLEFNGGVLANGIEAGDTDLTTGNTRYEVNAPVFLAVNTLGQLDVDLDFDNTTYDETISNTAVTLVLTSSYSLSLDDTFNQTVAAIAGITDAAIAATSGSTNGLILNGTQVAALLNEGDFVIDTATTTGFINLDKTVFTFNIETTTVDATTEIETGDTVSFDNASLENNDQATDIIGRNDGIQIVTFN